MSGYTRSLELAVVPLALLTAGIHLYWGIPRFTNYAAVGVMPDPRPALFVLSGHAILIGLTLVLLGIVDPRWTYLPGAVLMLAHLGGYAAWHTVLAHGLVATAETTGHVHDVPHLGNAAVIVLDHLVHEPLALASKLAELAVLGCLLGLALADGDG